MAKFSIYHSPTDDKYYIVKKTWWKKRYFRTECRDYDLEAFAIKYDNKNQEPLESYIFHWYDWVNKTKDAVYFTSLEKAKNVLMTVILPYHYPPDKHEGLKEVWKPKEKDYNQSIESIEHRIVEAMIKAQNEGLKEVEKAIATTLDYYKKINKYK